MNRIDKRALVDDLRRQLTCDIAVLTQAALATREAATHEDAKPENDKDTRAIEAGYLAGAQAERVRDLEKTRNVLAMLSLKTFAGTDPIAISALVEVACDDVLTLYFLAPTGGGMRGNVESTDILVITPQSPMGQKLLGALEGDAFELSVQRKLRQYEVIGVQ
jgi:hypothetical protein